MDQIIVTHLAGGTTKLRSVENTSSITKAVQSVELLNKDIVDITVESAKKLVFLIGDKINILGRDYTLNIPATETKVSEFSFQYTLQFEGVQYDLARATYDVNLDTTGSDLKGDSLTGDMKMFLDVLMLNIGRLFPGKWTLGTYPLTSETMTLTFAENDNCLSVLQTLCGKYGTEFDIVIDASGNRVLNIGQVGKDFTFTFEYGKNKGLYTLTREKVSSSNIVNRLKVYGSTRNITTKYRSTRLCLPGKNKSESYLEDAASIAAFGVWENAKIYEDIYPRRTGTITTLGGSVYSFVDTAMDFDLNEKEADGVTTKYLLPGTAAKIHFNTGGLAGYEFDIQSYDHETKTFTILRQTDERGMSFPSESSAAFQFAQGDEYVILDIALPQSYETAAETDLETAGTAYLADNCQPKVQYSLDVDHKFLKDIVGADVDSNIFWVGDNIPIKDTDIEVDKTIRIKGFERDLLKDYGYTLSISDLSVTRTVYSRVISEHGDQKKIIKFNRLNDYARARRNYLDAQEVLNMIFDPEGDFYSDKIKPLSIDTTMLSVGSKSMQFGLSNTIFQPNYSGNKNRVVYTGGSLVHYAILDANKNPRIWTITDGDVTLSTDADAYFVYAKCQKAASGGTMLFTTSKIIADSDPNYYHFLIGVINSVDSGTSTRSMSMMYGFSTINGRYIKTGRITSSGETVSYIDLDDGSMALGEALTWNIGGDKKLRIKGAIMQTAAGEDIVTVNHKGTYASGATYQKYDSVTYGGAVWLYINNTPSSGNTPAEGAYWTIYVAKGSGGSVALTVTKQAFNYNEAGALTDTGTWFVVATVFNIPGTLYYEWMVNDSTVQNATNYAYGLVPPANYANMPVKYKVNVRVGSTTGDIVATDMITIYGLKEGTGGVTAIVSNDAHVLAAGNDGSISSYAGSGTDIVVFIGTTPIPYGTGAGTFDVISAGSGITPGAASTVSTYTRRFADHNAMTLDNAFITYTIKVRNAAGTEITITKIQSFSKSKTGSAGQNGATATLTPSKQVFHYDSNGNLDGSGSWFVVCTTTNLSGTLYYEWIINDITVQNDTYSAYNLIPPALYSNMPVKYQVKVRVGSSSSPVVAQDTLTIYGVKAATDGTDAYTVVLSNESHTLPASSEGVVTAYGGSGTDIRIWLGVTPLAYGSGASTFDVTTSGTGITAGSASTVDTYTRRFADHSNMIADIAKITFTIKVRNSSNEEIIFTRVQSFSKSKAGAAGSPGTAGPAGPSLVYRGQWDSSVSDYTGTTSRIDVVRIGTEGSFAWYKAKTTAGTIPANTTPTNTTYWESFGGVFQSIATGLLLAESANIAEFIFKGGKLISQKGTLFGVESTNYSHASFIPYVSINGTTGDVTFKKATIEGALNAGSIGGFTIANERIGALSDANGLSILASLIKFYNSSVNVWAGIGENVLPPSSGLRALGRFDNKELQGYYQQQFLRYDYYYSEQSYYNAGSPTPANWVYDEYMQFQHIEVTIYQNVFVPYTGSLNYGIIAQVEGAEQNIAFQAIKGKIISSYGGVISWDTGYYGPASSYIIQWNIEKFSQFIFSSISSSLMNVYLPSSTDINDHTSGSVYFLLNITVGYETNNSIRLQSVTNGQLRDNDGNALSYIDMRKGDSILLRYSEGNYYIVSLRQ